MEKKYAITFFSASIAFFLAIFIFVTWINPWRITDTPWSIDFVSDRNMALKKFLLLKDNTNYTDLIVGSSTGEVFLNDLFKNPHQIQAYQGSIGGAKTPYKLAQINYAIKNNPNLKHIIYIVDFFEFASTELDTRTFYQKDILGQIDSDLADKLTRPDWISRAQDYLSESALKSSLQTFRDFKKFKKQQYQSQFFPDGSTTNPIVDHKNNQDLEGKTSRLAISHTYLYKNMTTLDSLSLEYFQRVIESAQKNNIKITFVLTPMRAKYYNYIKTYLKNVDDIYKEWIQYVKGFESKNVKIIDYSYPVYLDKGISDTNEHWHDGIHFGVKSAEIILKDVYK